MPRFSARRQLWRSQRAINRAIAELRAIAALWDEVDQCFVDEAASRIDDLESFAESMQESIDERLANGDHIGL